MGAEPPRGRALLRGRGGHRASQLPGAKRKSSALLNRIQAARAVLAATSLLALIGAPGAFAQQPPAAQHKAAPKVQPKQSAPKAKAQPPSAHAPAPATANQETAILYSPWTKVCQKEQTTAGEKEFCNTQMLARLESGQPLAAAMLIEVQGEAAKLMRIMLPLGIFLPKGASFAVDKNEPVGAPYFACLPGGCLAQREVTAEFVAKLKKGQVLILQGINPAGQLATYQLPLTDFAKANEGAPTDPGALAQQRKLEDELQRRARDARERLERQNGVPVQGDGGR